MNKIITVLFTLLINNYTLAQTPIDGEFTYQGELKLNNTLVTGAYDFNFILNTESDGTGTSNGNIIVENVNVDNGIFTTIINFANPAAFIGDKIWMQINVRDGASIGSFEALSPRQQIASTPYAIHAQFVGANAVGEIEINSSEVQQRITGTCTTGQFITAVAEDGTVTCSLENTGDIHSICKKIDGSNGVVINNICLLDYDNSQTTNWTTAAAICVSSGGDLCTASQYYQLSDKTSEDQLFYNNRAVWSNSFSDDDNNSKDFTLHSSDDPFASQNYAYGCCQNILPQHDKNNAENVNGVLVTYKHTKEDTTWRAASKICSSFGSDLCTKSQYVALNDSAIFGPTVRRATPELSDNDIGNFSSVVGTNSGDNGTWGQSWAYACCGTTKPTDLSCPGTQYLNGLCTVEVHDIEDTNFFNAARACTALGADICSNSQMQTLRSAGVFFSKTWTNNGADNDSTRVGGLLGSQPDNPNPNTDQFGYACCL